jgi:hypothetical protein
MELINNKPIGQDSIIPWRIVDQFQQVSVVMIYSNNIYNLLAGPLKHSYDIACLQK